MRIKRVQVKNYRSFDDQGVNVELPDIKHPIAIIGQNNSGKSNFISAMLFGVGCRSVNDDTFTQDDFHFRDEERPIQITVTIDPPLKSSDAFNHVKDMPILKLVAKRLNGVGEISHMCCDSNGKSVFNSKALSRGKSKTKYSAEEIEVLTATQKTGAETVRKWKHKLPVTFVDCRNIERELRANRFNLLGKVLASLRTEFDSIESVVEQAEGVLERHVGEARCEVFKRALAYLETHVLATAGFKTFVTSVEGVLKKQLDIESQDFDVSFTQPSSDYFFDNLTFFVSNHKDKPRLPISNMGNGFISLFVLALIRAIVKEGDGGKVFVIEEPETFQHEHFQEYFYRLLCDISENNQVIYTTHSKKFVNVFEPKSILHFSLDGSKSKICCEAPAKLTLPDEIDGVRLNNPADFAKYMRTLEPNIGNIAFASKVIVVEGPHDLIGYRTVLENSTSLGLKNIAIVAAWGKDTLLAIVQLCRTWKIPVFVIHDWDIDDASVVIDKQTEPKQSAIYKTLKSKEDKAQYTKNWRILSEVEERFLHHNKPRIESVLGIPIAEKSAASVYAKVAGKGVKEAITDFPLFFPKTLAEFVEIEASHPPADVS